MEHTDRFIIEDGVLKEYRGDERIAVPEGVREIGERAFAWDRGVVSVTLPEGLERIGKEAFYLCGRLKSVNIPQSVKEIGARAFDGCRKLTAFTPPAEDAVLGDDSFSECNRLADKDGFLTVGHVLYGYYGSEARVVVPRDVKKIGVRAFADQGEGALTAVTLPEGLEKISRDAFSCCRRLTSVSMSDTPVRIGVRAFWGCESLAEIALPEHAKIEDSAFRGCERLADENGFLIIRGILFDYFGGLSEVAVPEGVLRISEKAFCYNDGLLRVSLPESVKSLGRYAFAGCKNLERVDLPKGEISIEEDAFLHCDRLIKPKQK